MLFNSPAFAIFFPVVTVGYFLLPHRRRWLWLLAASCYFYMAFVPAYILILFFTIAVDYVAGIMIERTEDPHRRRFLLACSIAANVGVLALFKYFGFLDTNLAALARWLGWNYPLHTLGLILPIGLSFHTFQAMSYVIEVYRGRQPAERHLGIYALYVMFYPQLVAGPIERPQNLLPQFHQPQVFDEARVVAGLQLMTWGLFKKVVVADRLAPMVDQIYDHPASHSTLALAMGTLLFAFQIYGDFSGYSDIARGSASVMGIQLMRNFNRPYAAQSVPEFWRSWHTSLSTWFRDYLYIPLGGNRVAYWRQQLNILTVFLISGLWHGANWTFVIWGLLHGGYMIAALAIGRWRRRRDAEDRGPSSGEKFIQWATTFGLVNLAWVFFRSPDLSTALSIASRLLGGWEDLGHGGWRLGLPRDQLLIGLGAIVVMETIQAVQARKPDLRIRLAAQPAWLRWGLYVGSLTCILLFGVLYSDNRDFIYFQF